MGCSCRVCVQGAIIIVVLCWRREAFIHPRLTLRVQREVQQRDLLQRKAPGFARGVEAWQVLQPDGRQAFQHLA